VQRQRLIDEVDVKSVDEGAAGDLIKPNPDPEDEDTPRLSGPSMEAISKLMDYSEDIPSGLSGRKVSDVEFIYLFNDSGLKMHL
jgi:hypothetical protein